VLIHSHALSRWLEGKSRRHGGRVAAQRHDRAVEGSDYCRRRVDICGAWLRQRLRQAQVASRCVAQADRLERAGAWAERTSALISTPPAFPAPGVRSNKPPQLNRRARKNSAAAEIQPQSGLDRSAIHGLVEYSVIGPFRGSSPPAGGWLRQTAGIDLG
jgi:hypothetical protein